MTRNGTAAGSGAPAREPGLPWLRPVRTGKLEYDRVLFFSDAIFAIAITLLVVDIRVPSGPGVVAGTVLRHALPQMLGFGISFVVIGVFWVGHHALFRHIIAMDRWLLVLNLLFAGTVAFLPFPTALLSTAGDQTPAVVFYAAWVALAGLAEAAIWLYACRTPGLLSAETPAWLRRYYTYRMLRAPLIFLLSIPIAFPEPKVVPFTWLAIPVLGRALRLAARRHGEQPSGMLG